MTPLQRLSAIAAIAKNTTPEANGCIPQPGCRCDDCKRMRRIYKLATMKQLANPKKSKRKGKR